MTSKNRLTRSGWAIIVLSAAALALGGCGRKGPLELPPTASNTAPNGQQVAGDSETERASQPSVFNPSYGTDAAPAAPKGAKKSFILDPLLNSN